MKTQLALAVLLYSLTSAVELDDDNLLDNDDLLEDDDMLDFDLLDDDDLFDDYELSDDETLAEARSKELIHKGFKYTYTNKKFHWQQA